MSVQASKFLKNLFIYDLFENDVTMIYSLSNLFCVSAEETFSVVTTYYRQHLASCKIILIISEKQDMFSGLIEWQFYLI